MAELKFKMLADYTQAIAGGNQYTDMLNKARKELLKTKTTSEDYSKAVDIYKQAIQGLSEVIDRNGGTMADLNKVYNMASKEMVRLAQSVGTANEAYKKAAEIAELYDKKIYDLTKKNEELAAAEAERKRLAEESNIKADEIAKMELAHEKQLSSLMDEVNKEYEERIAIQNQLNAKNANLGFMMVTGDESGIANYTLREYEQTLRQVIAETGINSEETKKAAEAYLRQKEYVEELTASTNNYTRAVSRTTPAVDKFSTATKELDQTSKGYITRLVTLTKNILTFQLIMGPIRSAISGVKNTLKESMSVAAEAEQVYSKLSTVFDGFEDSARRASIALASSLGVARSTSASALSTVGDLLQAQGMGTAESLATATGWVKQFQDIIAFKDINMSLEEFAQNFMSGAAGNLRNFRTFGSIVKESAVNARLAAEGLDKLTGSQLELAKMTTRATMALEQQKNAVGATEREWDTMLSINRRLSEAWKQYKENLGETINSVLRPMKSAWADILDQINKAKKAQEEYNKGNKNPDVYDMPNSASDRASFTKRMLALTPGGQSPLATVTSLKEMDALQSQYYSELKKIFIEFGATVEDVSILMGDNLSDAIYAELKVLDARRKAEKDFLDAQKARKAKLSSAADSFSALQETLLGIAGVNFNPTSITELVNRGMNSDREMKDAIDKMSSLTSDIIKESLDSLDASDLAQTFGDVISRELGELDEADLLQGKADSYRKLFEAAWNAYLPGGIDSEERLALDNIKKSYKEATAALDEYNKKIQRQNALLAAYSTEALALSGYNRLKYESGLTGPESSKNLDMARTWDIPLQVEAFAKSLRDVGVELREVVQRSEAYEAILEDEANLKYQIALNAEYNAQVESMRGAVPTSNRDALAVWGMSERDQLASKRDELAAKHNALWVEYQKEIEALDKLTQLEAQKAIQDKMNPFSSIVNAWKQGQTAYGESLGPIGGGIVGILTELLTQTEAFSELTNLVSDTIVPILDAVMKPLIPMINVVKTIFDLLPWETLFEIFKMVAEVVVAISFPIKIIAAVIKNIYTAVHNILQRILHPITGGDQRPYESLEKILDDTNEKLEKISGLTFKIERNTEKSDLSALWDLYTHELIDEDTLYKGADVLQKNIPFEALVENRPIITVRIQNTIVDESGNILTSEERTLEENGYEINRPITHSWAGYSTSAVYRYQMAMGGR